MHHTHLERVEEHLRSVDKLAEAQTRLETDMALSAQPIKEFKDWMGEIKGLLSTYVDKVESRGMDHESRLVRLETKTYLNGRGKGRPDGATEKS